MASVYGTDNSETIDDADGVTNLSDQIFGLGGNDIIYGLGGNDNIKGGGGADTLNGGTGTDTAFYDDSDEGVRVFLNGVAGVGGTAEGDTLTGIENIYGSNYNDLLYGNSGNNVLSGSGGDDAIQADGGDDTIDGGAGIDWALWDTNVTGLVVNLATGIATTTTYDDQDTLISIENVRGTVNTDIITGNSGGNTLDGSWGSDELYGGGGNDTLIGGAGGDILDGGTGTDTATYFESDTGVTVNLLAGIGSGGDAEDDTLIGIENVNGSAYADDLWGNNGINVLKGWDGDDTLKGGGGADTLYGNDGNDSLIGQAGADNMYGGSGDDTYNVDVAGDAVWESGLTSEGIDTVYTSVTYTLTADQGIEILKTTAPSGTGAINLTGNGYANTIYGNAGTNVIDGGDGLDIMYGGAGSDAYFADVSGDIVSEVAGQGTDAVYASATYALAVNVENLYLQGTGDFHGAGNSHANYLEGNSGNNFLNGGANADVLQGGAGNDTFVFNAGQANGDIVNDFNGNGAAAGDALQFVGYGPGATLQQINATLWQIDYNGGASFEQFTLANGAAVDPGDYTFI
jgi:Ca2+-binding RTX toxin-like protein